MSTADNANLRVRDALDHAREAAQELHAALTDAATRRKAVVRDELAVLPSKAKSIADSLGHSIDTQTVFTRRAIGEAVTYLDATQTHIADALKSSGHAAEGLIRSAIADARQSVQKISEAVADRRAGAPAPDRAA